MYNVNRTEQIVLAAWMYYDEGLTQEKIAQKLGLSRVKVTRLLKQARDEGLVKVSLSQPLPVQYDLARQIRRTFGIAEVIVAKSYRSSEATLDAAGMAGANYLNQVLFPGCRLGVIGWGLTVSKMSPYLKPSPIRPCAVNELIGSFLGEGNRYNISMRIAEILKVPIETLPAPVFVQSKTARDALLKESSISMALQHARECDIAFVGLGDASPDSTLVRAGQLSPEHIEALRRLGVKGEILLRFYDSQGSPVISDLDEQVIALGWEDILHIPHIVAMVSGLHKVDAIVAALRGKLCHCLITDTETAEQVLRDK